MEKVRKPVPINIGRGHCFSKEEKRAWIVRCCRFRKWKRSKTEKEKANARNFVLFIGEYAKF